VIVIVTRDMTCTSGSGCAIAYRTNGPNLSNRHDHDRSALNVHTRDQQSLILGDLLGSPQTQSMNSVPNVNVQLGSCDVAAVRSPGEPSYHCN
jgi:hypothetical protein